MAKIGPSQDRRRARRATTRIAGAGVFAGSLPLSDRDAKWSAAAADKRVRTWAGVKDNKPNAKYDSAFFWNDGSDNLGGRKLGFVDIVDGKPTAIWSGVTAAAGAIQGARGGVKIPDGDVAGVKSKIASYYGAAKTKFKDDTIAPPWEDAEDKAEIVAAGLLNQRVALASGRLAARAALVASGDAVPSLVTNFEMTRGTPAERFFTEQALAAGFTEMSCDRWPCDLRTLEGDDGLVFRIDNNDRVYRLADGTLAHVRLDFDMLHIDVAGPSPDAVTEACFGLRGAYPASYLSAESDSRIPITFWSNGNFGPSPRLRKIEASTWDPIADNYTAAVRAELESLMTWKDGPGADGQLLLWQGPPGTGKTWALRALASEWSKWAEFHYITDPDAFFVKNPSYMVDVLLSDSYMAIERESGDIYEETDQGGKWRVLILEDTGELLGANAKNEYGQGLSRLLNVVDGMIGQGLRVLALVTTNDELGDLHPAVSRPGRCASQIEFAPLTADEATLWLGSAVDEPTTIAELFALGENGLVQGGEAFEEAAMSGPCANCSHLASKHLGPTNEGPCTTPDCDCNGMVEEAAVEASALEMIVKVRPDLSEFRQEMEAQLSAAGAIGSFTLTFDPLLADGAVAPALPDAHKPGEKLPPRRRGAQPVAPTPVAPVEKSSGIVWTATLCPEGSPTDDGRIFAPDSIEWRNLPLTLMAMITTSAEGGHDGAEVAGRIDRIWREGGLIRASGEFDPGEYGMGIARMVGDGTLRGVSVDLAISEMELQYRSSILDPEGNWIGGTSPGEESTPSVVDLLEGKADEVMFVVWAATIGMATVCPFQAFADATIELTDTLTASGKGKSPNPFLWTVTRQAGFEVIKRCDSDELVASAAPPLVDEGLANIVLHANEIRASAQLSGRTASEAGMAPAFPPVDWFENPSFEELTALEVDEDGRIAGHAAAWDVCHTGFPDVCVTAPHTDTNYAYFHLKEVICEDGERVSCGTITLDTGHAGGRLSRAEATAHYDHTGTAVADIVVGEDEFGIWVAGAVRPGVDETQVRILRGAVLSGDWRNVAGNLELVALLAVNVPGFPVPRVKALMASGADGVPEVLALTAAGITNGDEIHLPKATLAQFKALGDRASGRYEDLRARALG